MLTPAYVGSYLHCRGAFSNAVAARLDLDRKFLLATRKSRKPADTEYLISLDAKNTSERSIFLGAKFIVYDTHPPCAGAVVSKGLSAHMIGSTQVSPGVHAGNYPISLISYEGSFGSRASRNMNCVMDSISVSVIKGGTAPMQTELPSINSNSFASVSLSTCQALSCVVPSPLPSICGVLEWRCFACWHMDTCAALPAD